MIGGLVSGYMALYYSNIDTGDLRGYSVLFCRFLHIVHQKGIIREL